MLSELVRQVKPVELIPITEGEVRAVPVIGRDPIADIKNEIPFTYTEDELAKYHTLDVGDRSADVLALRKRLYALGYYTKPNENPLYTESTADVIKIFQADCGLEETGVADPYTQALLFDDRMLAREGSAQEVTYLSNKAQPLVIQRAEITSYSFCGSVQVSVRNNTTGKLTAFGLKIIEHERRHARRHGRHLRRGNREGIRHRRHRHRQGQLLFRFRDERQSAALQRS